MFCLRALRESELPDPLGRQLRKVTVAPRHPGGQRVTDRLFVLSRPAGMFWMSCQIFQFCTSRLARATAPVGALAAWLDRMLMHTAVA
jgi:hypothetical protein